MTKILNSKPINDLEEQTFQFAKAVRLLVKKLSKTMTNFENGKQLIKARDSILEKSNYQKLRTPSLFWSLSIGI